jgi:Fe-S oxidoreductase
VPVKIQIPCITKHYFPETAEKIISLAIDFLKDIEVQTDFTCCGLPFFENGDLVSAKKIGEYNLKKTENNAFYTCSEKCGQVFIIQYPKLFNNTVFHNEAQNLSKKTSTLLDMLLEISSIKNTSINLALANIEETKTFMMFDCSTDKQKQVKLLHQLGFKNWHSPSIINTCCGAGSCLPINSPKMAELLTNKIIDDALLNECEHIICFDDICRHQLNLGISKKQSHIKTLNVVDLFNLAS